MNKLPLHLTYFPLLLILITLSFPLKILSQSPSHTILNIKGTVTVKKEEWKNPRLAWVGLDIEDTDKLEVKANSSVKIQCSNNTIWDVPPGNYNTPVGCTSETSVIVSPNQKNCIPLPNANNCTRRTDGKTENYLATLPYIITPRESYILTNTPVLRWNAVEGATNYTVKIDRVKWETETNETKIKYPGETPLKEGRRYRITIETDNRKSSKSDDESVGFTLLDEERKNIVLEAKKTIEEQELSADKKGLILAYLYRGYELYAETIEILEELVKKDSQIVTIYQLLGDTYLQTGLPQLAKKPYEKGLDLATETENLSVQAEIQKGLGLSYYSLGNDSEAKQWLEKAKTSYEDLEDSSQVQQLKEMINLISGEQ